MHLADLLRLSPGGFASRERQIIASAFNQAWLSIALSVGNDPDTISKTRAWLAVTIVEIAKSHETISHETTEALANAAIFKAVGESLQQQKQWGASEDES